MGAEGESVLPPNWDRATMSGARTVAMPRLGAERSRRGGVRWPFLVALVAVALGLVLTLALRATAGPNSFEQEIQREKAADALARRGLPAAMAVLGQLQVPADFHEFESNCQWYRCYRVPQPTTAVIREMPSIVASLGGDNAESRVLQGLMNRMGSAMDARVRPIYRDLHVSAPPMTGCFSMSHRVLGLPVVHCAWPIVLDDNVLTVFLGLYFDRRFEHWRATRESEVDISWPSGSPHSR
jgi:hypothetical protein